MFKEQVFTHVKEYYKQNAPPVEEQKVEEPQVQPEADDGAGAEENSESDPLQEWEGEPLQECADLVYVLSVTNVSNDPLKFRILFDEKAKDSNVNLVWPRLGLVGTAAPNEESKVVALLPKKLATSEGAVEGQGELGKLNVVLEAWIDEKKAKNKAGAAGANDAN